MYICYILKCYRQIYNSFQCCLLKAIYTQAFKRLLLFLLYAREPRLSKASCQPPTQLLRDRSNSQVQAIYDIQMHLTNNSL